MDQKTKIVTLFGGRDCSCAKDEIYLQAVHELAREIRMIGQQYGMDNGNVLTDVIYYAVAMDLADHTGVPSD